MEGKRGFEKKSETLHACSPFKACTSIALSIALPLDEASNSCNLYQLILNFSGFAYVYQIFSRGFNHSPFVRPLAAWHNGSNYIKHTLWIIRKTFTVEYSREWIWKPFSIHRHEEKKKHRPKGSREKGHRSLFEYYCRQSSDQFIIIYFAIVTSSNVERTHFADDFWWKFPLKSHWFRFSMKWNDFLHFPFDGRSSGEGGWLSVRERVFLWRIVFYYLKAIKLCIETTQQNLSDTSSKRPLTI